MREKVVLSIVAVFGIVSILLDKTVLAAAIAVQHPFLTYLMNWFSNVSSLIIVLLIMTSLFLWEEKKKRWIKVALLSFIAASIFGIMLKSLIARPRPDVYLDFFMDQYSFPSTHAMVAFSLLPLLNKEFPLLKWFWLGFALLIALSRLYLGVHYLSDVVWGILIGYLIGKGAIWFEENKMLKWLSWKKIHP
jgi:undecaprenyl-diphosphatase